MTTEQKLKWLEEHQPANWVAINALKKKLGMAEVPPMGGGRRAFVIEPWRQWKQRGRSSN